LIGETAMNTEGLLEFAEDVGVVVLFVVLFG
jgi:hypothetical protein